MQITQQEAEIKFLFKYKKLLKRSVVQIVDYWYNHEKPKKLFILAALCNDLRATILTMNNDKHWNSHCNEIRAIVNFIAIELPKESNGSEEKVQAWLDVQKTSLNFYK